jgi:hypothetical protein
VPDGTFDEIAIEAELVEYESIKKGVDMFANVGNYGALQPNQDNYQYKAIPIYKGIGISIPKGELPKGTWIKISIFTNTNIEIALSTRLISGLI